MVIGEDEYSHAWMYPEISQESMPTDKTPKQWLYAQVNKIEEELEEAIDELIIYGNFDNFLLEVMDVDHAVEQLKRLLEYLGHDIEQAHQSTLEKNNNRGYYSEKVL